MSGEAEAEIHSVTLDRYHRHYPVALFVLFAGISWFAALVDWSWDHLPRMLLATVGLVSLFGLWWLGQKRKRLILSSGGLVEKGWILENVVHLHEVKHIEMTLADDSLGVNDDGIIELVASLFAQVTVRPMRWILRRTIYGGKSDVFYRGVLSLYDLNKKRLIRIEASDGWEHVEEMFERITDKVKERARELSAGPA